MTFAFTIVGQINLLAPIIAMPYMMTYAAVNYAFFALKTCEDRELKKTLNVANSSKEIKDNDNDEENDDDEDGEDKKTSRRKSKSSSEKDILLPDLVLSSGLKSKKKRASYGSGIDVSWTKKENDDAVHNIDFRDVHTSSLSTFQVDDTYKFSRFSNKWIAILGVKH